ncbi:MAG: IS66 family insertion sequence element accessory protein TnpB [Cypionkella sp.]
MDFRCGHQALALMVQTELKLDPHSGVTVVFRSKRGDRLKILVWDGTGMVLIYKVLEQGSFAWPKVQDGIDAAVAGAIRSAVRRSGLAAGGCASGAGANCGRMTH